MNIWDYDDVAKSELDKVREALSGVEKSGSKKAEETPHETHG